MRRARQAASPLPVVRDISWGVLPLVAGLFVLVEALERTGVIGVLVQLLQAGRRSVARAAACDAGVVAAFASNLVNNLPAGLLAGPSARAPTLPPGDDAAC